MSKCGCIALPPLFPLFLAPSNQIRPDVSKRSLFAGLGMEQGDPFDVEHADGSIEREAID